MLWSRGAAICVVFAAMDTRLLYWRDFPITSSISPGCDFGCLWFLFVWALWSHGLLMVFFLYFCGCVCRCRFSRVVLHFCLYAGLWLCVDALSHNAHCSCFPLSAPMCARVPLWLSPSCHSSCQLSLSLSSPWCCGISDFALCDVGCFVGVALRSCDLVTLHMMLHVC